MKKRYHRPELKTRHLELGVFGDYGEDRFGVGKPALISVIDNLNLHME